MLYILNPEKINFEKIKKITTPITLDRLSDATKTLRYLPRFGKVDNVPRTEFKYPSLIDLFAMHLDKPIQVIGLNYKHE